MLGRRFPRRGEGYPTKLKKKEFATRENEES